MTHCARANFWSHHQDLPVDIRARAKKQLALLKDNPRHPSLQFKKIGPRNRQEIWSARVTPNYRALALKLPGKYFWFRIGDHGAYDALIN